MSPYVKAPAPVIPGGDARYLETELTKIATAIKQLVDAVKALQDK